MERNGILRAEAVTVAAARADDVRTFAGGRVPALTLNVLRNPSRPVVDRIKAVAFVLALLPLARLVAGFLLDALGVNPIETITRSTGTWTLVFLLLTLTVTPLRRLTGWNWLLRLRRMLGLFAFFYVCLHLATYVWLDQFFDWRGIVKDIGKRPFVTVGFAAFVLLVPLAATSTNAMVKRLGAARWRALHRAVYLIAILGVVHYWWLVKKDVTQPAIYAAVLALLLGYRVFVSAPGTGSAQQRPSSHSSSRTAVEARASRKQET